MKHLAKEALISVKLISASLMPFAQDVCRGAAGAKEQRPGGNNQRRCAAVYKYLIGK